MHGTAQAEHRETLEEVFRRSSVTLVASLTRAMGPAHLDLVESVVQDAFLKAMEEWRGGAPQNPAGWLLAVARNLALDHLRRERSFRSKEEGIARLIEARSMATHAEPSATLKGELADEQLTMIFVACHPCNSVPSQIALALRTLCGLEIPAIARALFASEDAIEKRLVLARRRIRDGGLSFELPSPSELAERLDAVLHVLYLLFNEAYWGTSGPDIVQEDVAKEAIRLVSFVGEHPSTARPRVLALRSLMHFHASRFAARVDEDNNLVTLAGQDRSLWNRDQIDQGLRFLAASAQGEEVSAYHYEAAIAAVHATSLSHDRTDWARIVGFYDELCDLSPSPGARLSRAIAIGFRDGPVASLALLASLGADEVLRGLAPFHAARGEAHARLGEVASAHEAFLQARACSTNLHEQRYLDRRIARLLA